MTKQEGGWSPTAGEMSTTRKVGGWIGASLLLLYGVGLAITGRSWWGPPVMILAALWALPPVRQYLFDISGRTVAGGVKIAAAVMLTLVATHLSDLPATPVPYQIPQVAQTADTGGKETANELSMETIAATMINLNGMLCAEVLSVRKLTVGTSVYEVVCIEYRGGTGKKTYHLDSDTKRAWVP